MSILSLLIASAVPLTVDAVHAMVDMKCRAYIHNGMGHGVGQDWIGMWQAHAAWHTNGRYGGNGATIGGDYGNVKVGDTVVTDLWVAVGPNKAHIPCPRGYQNVCVWWSQGEKHSVLCQKKEKCRPGLKAVVGARAEARNDARIVSLDRYYMNGYTWVGSWDTTGRAHARHTDTNGHFHFNLFEKKEACATECNRIEIDNFQLGPLPSNVQSAGHLEISGEASNCRTTQTIPVGISWQSEVWKSKTQTAEFSKSWENTFSSTLSQTVSVSMSAEQSFSVGIKGMEAGRTVGVEASYERTWEKTATQSRSATSTFTDETANGESSIIELETSVNVPPCRKLKTALEFSRMEFDTTFTARAKCFDTEGNFLEERVASGNFKGGFHTVETTLDMKEEACDGCGQVMRCDPAFRNWSCCSDSKPCGEGEGDCDRNSHCQEGLVCVERWGFDTCETPGGEGEEEKRG